MDLRREIFLSLLMIFIFSLFVFTLLYNLKLTNAAAYYAGYSCCNGANCQDPCVYEGACYYGISAPSSCTYTCDPYCCGYENKQTSSQKPSCDDYCKCYLYHGTTYTCTHYYDGSAECTSSGWSCSYNHETVDCCINGDCASKSGTSVSCENYKCVYRETNCFDGQDNDGDGYADDCDPDCSGASRCIDKQKRVIYSGTGGSTCNSYCKNNGYDGGYLDTQCPSDYRPCICYRNVECCSDNDCGANGKCYYNNCGCESNNDCSSDYYCDKNSTTTINTGVSLIELGTCKELSQCNSSSDCPSPSHSGDTCTYYKCENGECVEHTDNNKSSTYYTNAYGDICYYNCNVECVNGEGWKRSGCSSCSLLTATDSDNGKNYNTKGTCRDNPTCTENGCEYKNSHTDYCKDSNTLVEYYTYSGSCYSETHNCGSDYICSDGACRQCKEDGEEATSVSECCSHYASGNTCYFSPTLEENTITETGTCSCTCIREDPNGGCIQQSCVCSCGGKCSEDGATCTCKKTTNYCSFSQDTNKQCDQSVCTDSGWDNSNCDTTPPSTSITPNGKDWTNSDVSFTLSCSDSGSGCSETKYSIIDSSQSCPSYNSLSNTGTSGTVSCPNGQTCEKVVCYASKDNAGNTESVKRSNTFKIDTTPSSTSDSIENTSPNNYKITLSCSDSGSGCSETKYCIDNSNNCQSNNIYSSEISKQCTSCCYIRYYSIDKAGNVEDVKSDSFGPTCNCIHSNPTVTITPSSQTECPGTSVSYTITVKNNDQNCGDETFDLSKSCPSGFTCTLSKSSLSISSGSSASATITVSSSSTTSDGTYTFSVTATNSNDNSYHSTGSADYVVKSSCSDTDGGKDYTTKGTVTDSSGSYTDTCTSGTELKEYYCDNGQHAYTYYDCSKDDCTTGITCSISGNTLTETGDSYGCSSGACTKTGTTTCNTWTCDSTNVGSTQSCADTTYYCCEVNGVYQWQTTQCPTPICVHNNPTVTITPSSQTGKPGDTKTYTITVKNNDQNCGSETFELVQTCPSGWNCALSTVSLSISSGSTSTANIDVTPPSTAADGTYTFSVKATNLNYNSYYSTGSANYVVTTTQCTDTDNGLDYTTQGTVTDSFGSYTDTCTSDTQLKEYYCNNGQHAYTYYDCSNLGSNYICQNGACIQQPTPSSCTSDSDCIPPNYYCGGWKCINGQCVYNDAWECGTHTSGDTCYYNGVCTSVNEYGKNYYECVYQQDNNKPDCSSQHPPYTTVDSSGNEICNYYIPHCGDNGWECELVSSSGKKCENSTCTANGWDNSKCCQQKDELCDVTSDCCSYYEGDYYVYNSAIGTYVYRGKACFYNPSCASTRTPSGIFVKKCSYSGIDMKNTHRNYYNDSTTCYYNCDLKCTDTGYKLVNCYKDNTKVCSQSVCTANGWDNSECSGTWIQISPKYVSPGENVTITVHWSSNSYDKSHNVKLNLYIDGNLWKGNDCVFSDKWISDMGYDSSQMSYWGMCGSSSFKWCKDDSGYYHHEEDGWPMKIKPETGQGTMVFVCRIPSNLSGGTHTITVTPFIESKLIVLSPMTAKIYVVTESQTTKTPLKDLFLKIMNFFNQIFH